MKRFTTLCFTILLVLMFMQGCATNSKKRMLQIAHDSISTLAGAGHSGISMVDALERDVMAVYCFVKGLVSTPCVVEEAVEKEGQSEASVGPTLHGKQTKDGDDPILAERGSVSPWLSLRMERFSGN